MSTPTPEPQPLDTWAVLELMGHRTVIGKLTERVIAGKPMLHALRMDGREQLYPPESVYAITPCTLQEANAAHRRQAIGYYGPAGLPDSLSRALAELARGHDDDDPWTEAGHDYQRAEMDAEDRRNEDHDDDDTEGDQP